MLAVLTLVSQRPEGSSFLNDLKQKLLLPQNEATIAGTRYNVPLINSLVLYVGIQVSFPPSVFSLERIHIVQSMP